MVSEPRRTALFDWHRSRGGRMVPFAGWTLPLQYEAGIMAEHQACRERCVLFDVSHMGTVVIPGDPAAAACALEDIICGDLQTQQVGTAKYTLLLNEQGGIIDDLMAVRDDASWYLVVNASRTAEDLAALERTLPEAHRPILVEGKALIALQGPAAEAVLTKYLPEAAELRFLQSREVFIDGQRARIARLGYTGEDGFEIALPNTITHEFVARVTADERVQPAGLGARDSLRLEAGLCLYGQDLDETTTPIAAGLGWTINKRRREAADFPGATRILEERAAGPRERLVGLKLEGRLPARTGADVVNDGRKVGRVTSGGFAPTVGAPIALAYVEADLAAAGTQLICRVRQHDVAAVVTALPFVPNRYHR